MPTSPIMKWLPIISISNGSTVKLSRRHLYSKDLFSQLFFYVSSVQCIAEAIVGSITLSTLGLISILTLHLNCAMNVEENMQVDKCKKSII